MNIFKQKNAYKTKGAHKGSEISDIAEILNSLNPELQLEDIESAIKSKPIDLLTRLTGFKFGTILVLVFKKIECEDKTKYKLFSFKLKSKNNYQ